MKHYTVQVLGRFQVFCDGKELTSLSPQIATALKILALNWPSIDPEVFAETLWPNEPSRVIRKRMRNVITRIRKEAGASLKGTRTGVIVFDQMDCDLVDFMREARNVLGMDVDAKNRLKKAAALLNSWKTPMLDDVLTHDWARDVQEQALELHASLRRLLHNQGSGDTSPSA